MQERYVKLENDIGEALINFIMKSVELHSPIIAEIKSHRQFEGRKSVILREDGGVDYTDIHALSSEGETSKKIVLYGSLREILETFRPVAESLASQKMEMMISVLDGAVTKTGNVVDGKGKPISVSLFLEILEKMPIDFNEDGTARLPTVLVPPGMSESIKNLIESAEETENKKAFEDLMRRKKAEWHEREANRILVG